MESFIVVTCSCGKSYRVKAELVGRSVRCRACQAIIEIPFPTAPVEPLPPAPDLPSAEAPEENPPPVPADVADKGCDCFPSDWGVIRCGDLETVLPAPYEKLVRGRLTEVAEKEAPSLWQRGPLGQLVQVERIRALHVWTVSRVTVTESRKIVDAFVPYQNERLPRQTVMTEDEVDADSFTFFPDDPDDDEDHADVLGSARVVVCHNCARGKVPCDACEGTGKAECETCSGTARVECTECYDGRVRGSRGTKNCPRCRGTGTVTCGDCRGGKAKCEACEGKGRVDCPTCGGRAKAVQVLRVEAVRTSTTEDAESLHQDLRPLIDILCINEVGTRIAIPKKFLADKYGREVARLTNQSTIESTTVDESTLPDVLKPFVEKIRDNIRKGLRGDSLAIAPGYRYIDTADVLSEFRQPAIDSVIDSMWGHMSLTSNLHNVGMNLGLRGFPLPPFRSSVNVTRHEVLGIPEDLALGNGGFNSAFSAVVGGLSFVNGPLEATGKGLPRDIQKEVAADVIRLSRIENVAAGQTRVIRDYLVVYVRTWISADYSYDGRSYRAFFGDSGVYAPYGSPLSDEPTRLVEEAQALVTAPQGSEAAATIKRALSHEVLWPTPESLAQFLIAIPHTELKHADKLSILDAVDQALPLPRGGTRGLINEWDGKQDCGMSDVRNMWLVACEAFAIDRGRVTPALVKAVRTEVEGAQKRRTALFAFVAIVGLALVALAWWFVVQHPPGSWFKAMSTRDVQAEPQTVAPAPPAAVRPDVLQVPPPAKDLVPPATAKPNKKPSKGRGKSKSTKMKTGPAE